MNIGLDVPPFPVNVRIGMHHFALVSVARQNVQMWRLLFSATPHSGRGHCSGPCRVVSLLLLAVQNTVDDSVFAFALNLEYLEASFYNWITTVSHADGVDL